MLLVHIIGSSEAGSTVKITSYEFHTRKDLITQTVESQPMRSILTPARSPLTMIVRMKNNHFREYISPRQPSCRQRVRVAHETHP
jgi:hypothetical protein